MTTAGIGGFLHGLSSSLELRPIGFIRTPQQVKFQARHQPADAAEERNVLELVPGCGYDDAMRDLAGFERVWLLWWFHKNTGWRPLVLPPRGPARRRGVFATRSPHRPNPLGMTPVRLIAVERGRLILGPCDLVDGTPVFDVKPYVPAYDAFPEARAGWIDELDAELEQPARFRVVVAPLAEEQARWLRETWQVDFMPRLHEMLSRDPEPHRTRRIKRRRDGTHVAGCGAWRAVFSVGADTVTVSSIEAGYPERFLNRTGYELVPDRAAQKAFLELWPAAAAE